MNCLVTCKWAYILHRENYEPKTEVLSYVNQRFLLRDHCIWGQKLNFLSQLSSFLHSFRKKKCVSNIENLKRLQGRLQEYERSGEVTHHCKYWHLGVLLSYSKKQKWACPATWLAFSVDSETKIISTRIVYELIGEKLDREEGW